MKLMPTSQSRSISFTFGSVPMTVLCLVLLCSGGCSRSDTSKTASAQTDPLPPLPNDPPADSSHVTSPPASTQSAMATPAEAESAKGWPPAVESIPADESAAAPITALSIADLADGQVGLTGKPELQLHSDLSPARLVDFLSASDQDMELIYSGRAGFKSQDEAIAKMQRIIRLKLEASRRLIDHADATTAEQVIGKRGELQALSHLASGGSIKAAEELETVANTGLESTDASLVSDSRLVLIGFALESLQNGKETAPAKIVELVNQFTPNQASPDVPAMMVMGQARELLSQYGHVDEAKQVREKILKSFANSSDPDVAMMAAKLAGAVQFDGIDKLRADAIAARPVAPADWTAAAQQLIDESRDLLTVQYLATTALELEGTGNDPLADATYEVLRKNFADPTEALSREVAAAISANEARNELIGTAFSTDLPTLEGETIEMSDYIGRIVLMPFWAAEFPASLQLLPNIHELREQNPNDVAIVGINLDSRASDQTANAKEKLGFSSFHSATDPSASVPNPLVKQFGMVSMPFLVVLDRAGKVADICFTERQLSVSFERLMTSR